MKKIFLFKTVVDNVLQTLVQLTNNCNLTNQPDRQDRVLNEPSGHLAFWKFAQLRDQTDQTNQN